MACSYLFNSDVGLEVSREKKRESNKEEASGELLQEVQPTHSGSFPLTETASQSQE